MSKNNKPQLLMLDDERFLLELYKVKFEKAGYEVFTCYDAYDALNALRGGYEPDVILFDITMPDGESGYQFIDTVQKENLAEKSLKVALTNEGQEAEIARTKELGAKEHLIKSKFTPGELVEKIAALLEAKN